MFFLRSKTFLRQALGQAASTNLETVEESSFDKELRENSSRKITETSENLTASDEFMLAVAQKLDQEVRITIPKNHSERFLLST